MTSSATLPLYADALSANQAGRLEDGQRRALTSMARSYRKNELVFAGILTIIGVLVLTGTGPKSGTIEQPLIGIGALVVAAGLVYRALSLGDSLTQDVRAGRVEQIEGAILKSRFSTGSSTSNSTNYFIDVAHKRFSVARDTYEAAPEAGVVRVYYLPRSKKVVNMEHLADRPVPEGALDSPMAAMQALTHGLKSHDSVERAEAAATAEAIGMAEKKRMEEMVASAQTPAPPGPRDTRPLAEAILGTWHNALMTVTFAGDGTASVIAALGGHQQKGRWSVDGAGKLHADAMGHEQAADAWITGDALTISAQGMEMVFQRAAAG